jgi:hypothetical protein
VAGVPLAVCARCFGLYAAAAAGALTGWATPSSGRDVPSRTARLLLGFAALPTIATVGGEWLHLIHPSSVARALAAVPLGIAAGWLIVRLLRLEGRRRSPTAHAASRG